MREPISYVLAVAVMVMALLAWPIAGEAQLGDVTGTVTDTVGGTTDTVTGTVGDVTGGTGDVTGTIVGTTTTLVDTGTLVAGTSDALGATQGTASIPSLLSGEVLQAVTIGYADQIDSVASLAALALNLAGTSIGADFVMARVSTVFGAAGVGTSIIDNLSIAGVPVSVTGAPNQTVAIPGGVVVLNEQQVSGDGTTVVNALHATVFGVADVVVASATAGPSGGAAQAVQASY